MPLQKYIACGSKKSDRRRNRSGVARFVLTNMTIGLALITGLALISATVGFTVWVGKQIPTCPDWALSCDVPSHSGQYTPSPVLRLAQVGRCIEERSWPLLLTRTF